MIVVGKNENVKINGSNCVSVYSFGSRNFIFQLLPDTTKVWDANFVTHCYYKAKPVPGVKMVKLFTTNSFNSEGTGRITGQRWWNQQIISGSAITLVA